MSLCWCSFVRETKINLHKICVLLFYCLLLSFITSLAKVVMFLVALVCLFVCLSVCGQHYSKSYEWIGMKFYGWVLGSTMKNWLHSGGDLGILRWVNEQIRSTQRAQISLAEADHYSHIAHCKNVEPWRWKTTPPSPPPKKKKKKNVLDHYLHHDLGMLPLLSWFFFCSFTHLRIPRSPPKFNQFFTVLPRTPP